MFASLNVCGIQRGFLSLFLFLSRFLRLSLLVLLVEFAVCDPLRCPALLARANADPRIRIRMTRGCLSGNRGATDDLYPPRSAVLCAPRDAAPRAARMRNSVQIENNVALGENRPPADT
jgi:hypothetical protein